MGFLDKVLGRGREIRPSDPHGIYVYVKCDNCGEKLRIRADKRHDLMRDYETDELIWKKEIMDARCFQIMYATVVFDGAHHVRSRAIEGQGHFITEEEYLEVPGRQMKGLNLTGKNSGSGEGTMP